MHSGYINDTTNDVTTVVVVSCRPLSRPDYGFGWIHGHIYEWFYGFKHPQNKFPNKILYAFTCKIQKNLDFCDDFQWKTPEILKPLRNFFWLRPWLNLLLVLLHMLAIFCRLSSVSICHSLSSVSQEFGLNETNHRNTQLRRKVIGFAAKEKV